MQLSDINALWKKQSPDIDQLRRLGAKRFFAKIPDIRKAFALDRRSLCCIDGGIAEGLHVAGSGVLLPLATLRDLAKNAGIDEFTTHESCGAFAKAFPGVHGSNQAIQTWGQSVAKDLDLPYRHIRASDMDRPIGFHNEVVAYYDATGRFNRISGLPIGFVISRLYSPDTTADLQRAIGLAFEDNAFNERFSYRQPFQIIILAHPSDRGLSLDVLTDEVRTAIKGLQKGKLAVAGLKTSWLLG